ncbi:VIT1/CCC1 transporter family protein [Roseateles violae]|uniref:VIT1/CCC1 transporter family protein n=1 Tax=Roseateles violae TaxID=3058042 RepID=A0ABT8DND3_9BURK|nr:VIT1/CCC1 transporter family protein [Pelomonas sp. PFR6]MDN3919478.1 VIT1/CCC1 transporter family protein [Pelomonas sp. PFR6]
MNATAELPGIASAAETREPVLSPIDRVCELCFGLFMALTFVGAVSAATHAEQREAGQLMFYTALGCNLAWGLADGVMYLVRTLTERARRLWLATAIRAEADEARGIDSLRGELSGVMRNLVGNAELAAIRRRLIGLPELPPRARLNLRDFQAAGAVFVIVVLGTFPVALPFLIFEPKPALLVSRVLTLAMLFACGLALGRYAGGGGWKSGLTMILLGCGLTAAIIALGG